MKTVLASSLILVVAAIALFAPWYPLTTSQVVLQTQSYTTQFTEPTTTYQTVAVYTLPSPVQLQSDNSGGSCSLAWYYCNVAAYWRSQNLTLQTGVTYTVTVNECQQCGIFFEAVVPAGSTPLTAPQVNINVAVTGSGETSFVVPASAIYQVVAASDVAGTINDISITASVPQSVVLTQTLTTYAMTSVTQYYQSTLAPYSILGATISVVILVLLAVVVVLVILFGRGVITVSGKGRKR
ncbi:MAG: hypothetical protein ACLP5V_08275 [Candidatus Bathyarchaeia archaeon]